MKIFFTIFFVLTSFTNEAWAGCVDDKYKVSNMKNEGQLFIGPLSTFDVEKEHTITINVKGQQKPVVFGYGNETWLKLKKHLVKGAELYLIRLPEEIEENRSTGEIVSYGAIENGCVIEIILALKSKL